MDWLTPQGPRRYDDLVTSAARAAVCLDYDGVLAPIVDDPSRAAIHPGAHAALAALARTVRTVAVVTGRPARQAVALGQLDELGSRLTAEGHDLLVLGQYGSERWSARTRRIRSPRPPRGLAALQAELPEVLRRAGLGAAFVEDKGLAVAVHTRRLADPQDALARLEPVLRPLAAAHGLVLEPGRFVLEVRAPGRDKGTAVRTVQRQTRAEAVMFVGDDLGDVAAFRAVAALRRAPTAGLLVCSGSEEQQALRELADLVVEGPDGVMRLLAQLAADAAAAAGAEER